MGLKVVTECARTGCKDNLVGVDDVVPNVTKLSSIVLDIDLEHYFHIGELHRVVVAVGVNIDASIVISGSYLLLESLLKHRKRR